MGYSGWKTVHDVKVRNRDQQEKEVMIKKTPGPSIRVPAHEKVSQEKPAYPKMEFQYESLAECVIPIQQLDRGNNDNRQTTQ